MSEFHSSSNEILSYRDTNPSSDVSNYSVETTPVLAKNLEGKVLQTVLRGTSVNLSSNFELIDNASSSVAYVGILEVFDKNGLATDLRTHNGVLTRNNPEEIRVAWKPSLSGEYELKLFVLSSLSDPIILSQVVTSKINVVHTQNEFELLNSQRTNSANPRQNDNNSTNVISEDRKPEVTLPMKPAKYTFMVYLVASDLESDGYYATADLKEMMQVGSDANVNVVVETGGSANSTIDDTRFIDFTKVQRHLISNGTFQTLEDRGKRSMGTWSELQDFVKWGVANFPADKYVIVLWDHGAGLRGFGHDDIYNDTLTLTEIYNGLEIAWKSGHKFELIGFDACLMASVEVVGKLAPLANYFVASEDIEPSWGWDYTSLLTSLEKDPAQDGKSLGKVVVDSYIAQTRSYSKLYENYDSEKQVTMSVLDMSQVSDLVNEVKSAGFYLDGYVRTLDKSYALTKSVMSSERYGIGGSFSSGHLDLYDFANNLDTQFPELAGNGDRIKSAVNAAVVYSVSGEARQNSHGISIFMQAQNYEQNAPYLEYIIGDWISVLENDRKLLESDHEAPGISLTMDSYEPKTIRGKILGDDTLYVTRIITQPVKENRYQFKVLSILQQDAGDFIPKENNGLINFVWDKKIMSLCNGGEEDCRQTNIIFLNNADAKLAFVPVRLESDRYNGTLYLIYSPGKTNETMQFLGGWAGLDEQGNAKRDLIPLLPGDKVFSHTEIITYVQAIDNYTTEDVEEGPIVVKDGFGPAYHMYSGAYDLTISACDFSDNCGYSSEFHFVV